MRGKMYKPSSINRTIKSIPAGKPGTKNLVKVFGENLLVLRYRKNIETKEIFRTVEFMLPSAQGKEEVKEKPQAFSCQCGSSRFYASQLCHHRVIVDGTNEYQEDIEINEIGKPYGPYTCLKCGRIYESLDQQTPAK
jgi:hypothetical protein